MYTYLGKFSIFLQEINILFPRDVKAALCYFGENMQYQDTANRQIKRTQPDVSYYEVNAIYS